MHTYMQYFRTDFFSAFMLLCGKEIKKHHTIFLLASVGW